MVASEQKPETEQDVWTRVETREQFIACFADQPMSGAGSTFVIHASGEITGKISGLALSGNWYWQGALFWRRATLGGEDLGWDSEVIERSGCKMRYMSEGGLDAATVVTLSRPPGDTAS